MKINNQGFVESLALFSGNELRFDPQEFSGAKLTAVFGGIEIDLRNAVITKDCVINIRVLFGGIDILLPENVKARVNSAALFGGVSDKTNPKIQNDITVYINGFCMFGGVDIK